MIAAGLPVITSRGCELSNLISNQGAGLIFDTGNWQGLGEQILNLAKKPDLCSRMAKAALDYAQNELSFAATTTPVRAWVQKPQLAPDKKSTDFRKKLQLLEFQTRSKIRQVIWQVANLDRV